MVWYFCVARELKLAEVVVSRLILRTRGSTHYRVFFGGLVDSRARMAE